MNFDKYVGRDLLNYLWSAKEERGKIMSASRGSSENNGDFNHFHSSQIRFASC